MDKVEEWNYEVIEKIGEGCFGEVYMCRNCGTDEIVAIKMIIIVDEFEGVPSDIIREISLLKELDHVNIVRLLDVLNSGRYVYLVFEYLELDLHSFIKSPSIARNPLIVKKFLKHILRGVAYCHSHKVLHRDLKPANLLIDLHNKIVKLADFGMARAFGVPLDAYTGDVVTPLYKAPELLLGSCKYSSPVDVWSVGCIFGEMVTRKPLFPCDTEIEQLGYIFRVLGTPNEETWPGVTSLCSFLPSLPKHHPADLNKEFHDLEPAGVDLLSKMLCLDPSKRITATDALQHPYFKGVQNVC